MIKHLFPLFAALLVTAAAFGGYAYMLTSIDTAVAAVSLAREEISAAEQREAFARTASTFLADTAVERTELDSFITQDADFVSVIETVEASAKREGVSASVGSVNVRAGDAQFHERVAMTLSVTGPFPDVVAFVASLETLPVASRVTQVSFQTSLDRNWFGTIMLEFIKRKSDL